MTKKEKMLALRKWFNPDNYGALLDLTVEELWQEFRHRQQMFFNCKYSCGEGPIPLNAKQEEQIFS